MNSKSQPLLPLLKTFILQNKKGKRTQANGKKIKAQSIKKYESLLQHLTTFSKLKNYQLEIFPAQYLNKKELEAQRNYWNNFYTQFTDYLYFELNCFDNYVGAVIKSMRTFFIYLQAEQNISVDPYKKYFFCYQEKIPILVISPERLHFLIYDNEFDLRLTDFEKAIKKIIVFGCTVALRYSDIMALTMSNVVHQENGVYLKTRSIKSQTYTSVKLPKYVLEIIQSFDVSNGFIFPQITLMTFNSNFKKIALKAGWTEECPKMRSKKGELLTVFKNNETYTNYRFCDLMSSHAMRRTAITTMLLLGMQEMMVRKISGHAAGSAEFFRYVELAQSYLDKQTDDFHQNLQNLNKKQKQKNRQ